MYLNKAFIIGNLTRDPELKALPSGMSVASFSVATNRMWKDASGARQEATDYHNIVVFGRQAETVSQYMKKGSNVFVEGRMQTRSWDGQDGKKQYRTEVVADRVQFGSRASGAGEGAGATSFGSSSESSKKTNETENALNQLDSIEYPEEEINPEDIPF